MGLNLVLHVYHYLVFFHNDRWCTAAAAQFSILTAAMVLAIPSCWCSFPPLPSVLAPTAAAAAAEAASAVYPRRY